MDWDTLYCPNRDCSCYGRPFHQGLLVMLYLWQGLSVAECQLDELWSFVHTKEQNLISAKLVCETYGDA